ncbi:DoxX family protein [Hahella aquimaris]|uniref:DoxX family protein n=1 Tax=Hahella sp. HNIBRBA332 TaxID=3015983 RepID=UPI00273AA440|nr:DoxX family protein [Hahella sp. HNIBRBA332]WLQ12573.1 DoxX family protein [Hahella sp. HNIBRBA332]
MPNALIMPFQWGIKAVEMLQPIYLLAIRIYLAKIYFMSGMTKIKSWSTTLALFEYEYSVPVVSPAFAAYSSTAVELICSVLLVVGFGARIGAAGLLVLSIVGIYSAAELIGAVGVKELLFWGGLLSVIVAYGPGLLSADHWLRKRYLPSA